MDNLHFRAYSKRDSKNVPYFDTDDEQSFTQSDPSFTSSLRESFLTIKTSIFTKCYSTPYVCNQTFTTLKRSMQTWNKDRPSNNIICLPLNHIITTNNPFLALIPYDPQCTNSYSNFIALLSNSLSREMVDMFVYIIPGLIERSNISLARDECMDCISWWNGFGQYLLAVFATFSELLQSLSNTAASQISHLPFQKRKSLHREYNRCLERLLVTSELPIKALNQKMIDLIQTRSSTSVLDLNHLWTCLSNFILQTVDDCWKIAKFVEHEMDNKLPEGKQRRFIRNILCPPRNLKTMHPIEYRANMAMCMTRWMKDGDHVVAFAQMFFNKRDVRRLDTFATSYTQRRKIREFQFERKPKTGPLMTSNKPSRVTFRPT